MKKVVNIIENLPKWYGLGIILIYSVLLAEYFSALYHLMPFDVSMGRIFTIITRISYVASILSGIIIWILMTFLFHLTATLFDGKSTFGHFLLTASYPYIIPAVMIVAGISLIDTVQIPKDADVVPFLMGNQTFQLAVNLVNYSFLPYYILVAIIIHYVHQIKFIYSCLSIVFPVFAIWGITELIKLI
ncbi:hypothetical protein FACS189430_02360 [Bacteroidia bacterium]|nr:hypothetical protein FACS189430_02360 [Bacteroidia bacterium]